MLRPFDADSPREPYAPDLLFRGGGDTYRYYEMRRRVRRRWPRVCTCGREFVGRFVRCEECRQAARQGGAR